MYEMNTITRNAFRLKPGEAEHYSDMIADAMKQEAAYLHYAGRDDIVWRPVVDAPARRPSSRALRREEVLQYLDEEQWRPTIRLCQVLGRSGSALRSMLNRMCEEGLVERNEVRNSLVEWRKIPEDQRGIVRNACNRGNDVHASRNEGF